MSPRTPFVKDIQLSVSEDMLEALTGSVSLLQLIIDEKSNQQTQEPRKSYDSDHLEFLKLIERQFSSILDAIREKYY